MTDNTDFKVYTNDNIEMDPGVYVNDFLDPMTKKEVEELNPKYKDFFIFEAQKEHNPIEGSQAETPEYFILEMPKKLFKKKYENQFIGFKMKIVEDTDDPEAVKESIYYVETI